MASHISDKIYGFCTDSKSVSSEYANDTSKTPGHYAETLYGGETPSITEHKAPHERESPTKEGLERARQCGNWGDGIPSTLFLQCFHDALCSLEYDPLAGMVSPSLMGSNGVIPLTIIAPLPDICRHMANLIARASHEVFLATNFWINSDASQLITNALRELSRRAGERQSKVVVKVMYDRGNIKQIIDNHQIMSVEQYTAPAVKLPGPDEIPNIDLQVQNYHRPALGTFHSKFMVVDRRIAIVNSNNIQDNDNMEMMTHLEGPIVDSIYDTALMAWYSHIHPPLPCLNMPGEVSKKSAFDDPNFQVLFSQTDKRTDVTKVAMNTEDGSVKLPLHACGDPHYDPDIPSEIRRMQDALAPVHGETRMEALTRHFNLPTHQSEKGTAPDCEPGDEMVPMIPHRPHTAFPIALVNRRPWGAPNHQCVNVPQNEAWISAIRNATSSIFIQTPNLNAAPLLPALKAALERGIEVTYYVCLGYNDAGELLPLQGGTNEMAASRLYDSLFDEAKKRLHVYYYVAKDQDHPIHNGFKARSCHIKLMIVDGHLGIQGNGNQDTQSWFHSMEVNVMIDSEQICSDWLDGIRRNQNTHLYGRASQEDGVWRDSQGNEAKGAVGKNPGRFSWARGIVGAVQRVRGAGGF